MSGALGTRLGHSWTSPGAFVGLPEPVSVDCRGAFGGPGSVPGSSWDRLGASRERGKDGNRDSRLCRCLRKPFLALLGRFRGALGALIGPSWDFLSPSRGRVGALLEVSEAVPGCSWDRLGGSREERKDGNRDSHVCQCFRTLCLAILRRHWGTLGAVLRPSWGFLSSSWGLVGGLLEVPGAFPGGSWNRFRANINGIPGG